MKIINDGTTLGVLADSRVVKLPSVRMRINYLQGRDYYTTGQKVKACFTCPQPSINLSDCIYIIYLSLETPMGNCCSHLDSDELLEEIRQTFIE